MHVCASACRPPFLLLFKPYSPQIKKALEAGTFSLREGAVCSVEVGAPPISTAQHTMTQHDRPMGPSAQAGPGRMCGPQIAILCVLDTQRIEFSSA